MNRFEGLAHLPNFELPAETVSVPEDLISLIEENYDGLTAVTVSRMTTRGRYDQVARIMCIDVLDLENVHHSRRPLRPTAPAAAIAEYCILCAQHDIEVSVRDNILAVSPGREFVRIDSTAFRPYLTYKVTLLGPPGRGRFERSKHIGLSLETPELVAVLLPRDHVLADFLENIGLLNQADAIRGGRDVISNDNDQAKLP